MNKSIYQSIMSINYSNRSIIGRNSGLQVFMNDEVRCHTKKDFFSFSPQLETQPNLFTNIVQSDVFLDAKVFRELEGIQSKNIFWLLSCDIVLLRLWIDFC